MARSGFVRPGGTAAQGQDRVGQRERPVGAQAEFAAAVGDALRTIAQRKGVAATNRTRQRLTTRRNISDSVTAAVTLPPTLLTTRRTTPSPSDASKSTVSTLAPFCSG